MPAPRIVGSGIGYHTTLPTARFPSATTSPW